MAKKVDPTAIDALVNDALFTLATAEGKRRLVKKKDAEYPALFPSEAGANKAAILRCKDEARPLVRVVGSGKTESVELTAAGFEAILPRLPEEKVGAAARPLAESLPPTERIAFLQEIVRRTPLATAELLPVLEAAIAAEKTEQEARAAAAANRREQEEASRKAITRWLELLDERKQHRIAALLAEARAEGWTEEPASTSQSVASPPVAPRTPEEQGFRREVMRRLVGSWREAVEQNRDEPARYMEAGIGNIRGVRQLGEAGETVRFDGEFHEADEGISTGANVRVARPGWVIDEDDDRHFVVLKAKVTR